MSDVHERLARLEEDRDTQRRRWVYAAAKNAGLHDPAIVADKLVDASTVVTAADADRLVDQFAQANPYMRAEPEQITPEEQRRRWGEELLAGIDASSGPGGRM